MPTRRAPHSPPRAGRVRCTGYLVSIPGPIAVGALYQHSGGWNLPIALIAGLLVPQTAAGLLAGRPRHIEDELDRSDRRDRKDGKDRNDRADRTELNGAVPPETRER